LTARVAAKKSPAADRTIDLFSGKTAEDEEHETTQIQEAEDAKNDVSEGSPHIEDNLDRYRDKAFEVQEWSNKYFPKADGGVGGPGSSWRLNRRKIDGKTYWLLEKVWTAEAGGKAASYLSMMFLDEPGSLFNLADVVVAAARAVKAGK
jgi:hypothetical protein